MKGQITLTDIDDRLDRLEQRIIREFGSKIEDHEKRIRENEQFKDRLYYLVTIVPILISLVVGYFWTKVVG